MTFSAAAILVGVALASPAQPAGAAADLSGRVLFSGLAVPAATVTAMQRDRTIAALSDEEGAFRFADLDEGTWTLRVEMRGFVSVSRGVILPLTSPLTVSLTMRPYAEIVGDGTTAAPPQRLPPIELSELPRGTPAVNIINGSVNNAAASPFAQPRAFGNNRPKPPPLYNGSLSAAIGTSAWNARPFSFSASTVPAPSYDDVELGFTLGGPLRIPALVSYGPMTFINVQHGVHHKANTQSALMPTATQRAGDLSESSIVIPPDQISPQAAALLAYYPLPNVPDAVGANYEKAIVTATKHTSLQLGLTQTVRRHTTLTGTIAFQRMVADSVDLFDFQDRSRRSSLAATADWSRRFSSRLTLRLRYQFVRNATKVTPFFARRTNVSGEAGIAGNNQDPENWGPPTLAFPDITDLTNAVYERTVRTTHAAGGEASLRRGSHTITMGSDLRRNVADVTSQPDPRGTLSFTGALTGNAFADFLLGIPSASSIAFGDAGTRLRANAYDAYVVDDWRVSPNLTLSLGARWEYEAPFTEASGRLVNLEGTPNFTAIRPVVATSHNRSLIRPDKSGFQPRIAASWRPMLGSSLIFRAGYGVYRNLGAYESLALLLAQQPPFSKTFSIQNGPVTPLTLANPFPSSVAGTLNTFAVDSNFRSADAHTWQASVQRELPASLTAIATYSGTRGTDLMQAFLPNTYPAGAENPCPVCPAGFVYLTSNGSSIRHTGQLTLRRRLHNGLSASAQYTLSKSIDDAATFNNKMIPARSFAIAQNWLDPGAERSPSSFDQRHLLSAQVQYTTGVGVTGGTLVDGIWGTLFKDWTFASQLTAGSGMPLTPIAFLSVAGTGVVGVRPRVTGMPPRPAPPGSYVNPAAYATPMSGTWGDAGRHSIRGPAQFALDASLARVIRLHGRWSLEWRLAATNVLNRVTYAAINTVITSPQFGRPTRANPIRAVETALRVRF